MKSLSFDKGSQKQPYSSKRPLMTKFLEKADCLWINNEH